MRARVLCLRWRGVADAQGVYQEEAGLGVRKEYMQIFEKLLSGRFISTVALVITYCSIMLIVSNGSMRLLVDGKDSGKELLIFVIGNFTGTAMGAVIAYHFKKTEDKGEIK